MPYTTFKEIADETPFEDYDKLFAVNNASGYGWWTSDDVAVFGKVILAGEDYSNDDVIGAESEVVEVPLLSHEDALTARTRIYAEIPFAIMPDDIKYYILVNYG